MSYTVDIQLTTEIENDDSLDVADLQLAAQMVLAQRNIPQPASLSLILDDDDTLQALNAQYRGKDVPTDVLSFPAEPMPEDMLDPEDGQYLGDILISVPYVQRRLAQPEFEHSLQDEMTLLVVHGTLHLLGFDHNTIDEQITMWKAQDAALNALGVHMDIPDYIHNDNK